MKAHRAEGSAREASNVALVGAALEALEARDGPAFFATLTEDAAIDEMVEPQPSAGSTAVKAWFDRWTAAVPDARLQITGVISVGEFVLMQTVVRGTLKAPLGRVQPAEKRFAVHRAAIVELRGGRIARLTWFMNGKELAQQVGQWPPKMAK
jgi:steroid delta-isomerase-like uncharacterized protein